MLKLPTPSAGRALWKQPRFWLGLLLGGLFSAWFIRGINGPEFLSYLKSYQAGWLLLAFPVYSLTVWLRAHRWKILLQPLGPSSTPRLSAYICAGYMGNNVTPMRLGEILRTLLCSRREGIPFPGVFATIALERVLDAAAMLLLLGVSLVFAASRLNPELAAFLKISFLLGGLGVAVFFTAARNKGFLLRLFQPVLALAPDKIRKGAEAFLETFLGVLGRLSGFQAWVLFGTTLGFWLVEALFYFLVAWGFPFFQDVGWAQGLCISLLTLAVANLAMIIPSPGYAGTFHWGVTAAVSIYGVEAAAAKALAVVLHIALIVPVTIAGGLFLLFYKDLLRAREMRPRLPFGLCAWGLTHNLGLQGAGTARANQDPKDALWMARLAAQHGLSHVELSSGVISRNEDPGALRAFREDLGSLGLGIVLSGPPLYEPGALSSWERCFEQARVLGARHLRTTLSHVLCGERSRIGGLVGWKNRLQESLGLLRQLGPRAEDLGLKIAIENHQDATSWDLMALCEGSGSPAVGITLDCGNPLAVGESVLAFTERVLPRLFHAHLKDYTLHAVDGGYLLARCSIGQGVVPYPELFRIFTQKPDMTLSLELSALEGRPIMVEREDWWAGFDMRDRAEAMTILAQARASDPMADPRTPWEKGEGAETAVYEVDQVAESVKYLSRLCPPRT